MSSLSKRRAGRTRSTPRVPSVKSTRLHLEHLEDRTMLDASGVPLDPMYVAAGRQITSDFFVPQEVRTKNGITATPTSPGIYTGQWVVGVPAGMTETGVASRLGATSVGATGIIQNTYVLDFGTQFADQVLRHLQTEEANGQVEWYYPLLAVSITPEFTPNDALYSQEWHLNQATNEDINAPEAWDLATNRGASVVIGIVDDGVEMNHPDLAANLWTNTAEIAGNNIDDDGNGLVDDRNGWDFLNNDNNPSPEGASTTADPHGTAVAGMAAGVGNNTVGVAGVAFNAKFAPIRLFSNTITPAPTDQQIASSMLYKNQAIQIYNNSWGPTSSTTYQFAGPLTLAAYNTGIVAGRNGKGSIIVRSAGNNGTTGNVNKSMVRNHRNNINVASVLQTGATNTISNVGTAILVSAPTNPSVSSATLTNGTTPTTDRQTTTSGYNFNPAGGNDDYTNRFGDTSAAAAVVSGVVALMLDVNPNLLISDVQEILARTARKNNATDVGWVNNGAGLPVHLNYGFGVVNAQAAVQMAQTWVPRPQNSITSGTQNVNLSIPDSPNPGPTTSVLMPNLPNSGTIQAVEVEISLTHTWRGDLNFTLTAPSGTTSILTPTNTSDSTPGAFAWTFTTFRDMGENAAGNWTLAVNDGAGGDVGTLFSWKLNIYGATPPPPAVVGNPDSFTVAEDTTLTVAAPGVLGNDVAATGAILLSNPTNAASFSFNTATGAFNYTPKLNYFGPDSFTYRPTQGALQGGVTTVSINVTPVNDAPVAVADPAIIVARPSFAFTVPARGVLANDTDVDNNPLTLTAQLVTAPIKGTLNLASNGGFTFTPRPNTTGPDSFVYRAFDGALPSNNVTITMQVNTPPVSRDESFNTIFQTAVSGQVLTNDTDFDQNVLKATLVTGPANGTLVLNPTTGSFTYTPKAGFAGIDTFVYRADDPWYNPANPQQVGNTATVSIRVDQLPVALPETFQVDQNSSLEVFMPGVQGNDYDLDIPKFNDVIQTELVTPTTNGTLTLGVNGYVKYVPNPGFNGTDSFVYRNNDGLFPGLPTTVTIIVNPTPTANADSYVTFGGSLVKSAAEGVLANDTPSSGLSAQLLSTTANGSLTFNSDGSFSYAAVNGFVGVDTFSYYATDGVRNSQPATVTISVFGLNRPPVANNDAYSVTPGLPLSLPNPGVLANDTDPDGQPLLATLVTGPTNGTLNLSVNGGFTYTPLPGFIGVDSFTYQAADGLLLSNTATVTLTVGTTPPGQSNPARRIVLGQEVGGQVKVFAGESGQSLFTINAFPGFTGGVRVATGDVTGDGVPDIFVAPSAQTGTAAALKLRGFDGVSGLPLPGVLGSGLSPFGTIYKGGMQVTTGDLNGDGTADLIVGADKVSSTQTLQVRVFNGDTGALFGGTLGSFKPFTGTTFGGVRVAAGDVNGDGRAEIIVAPGAGAGPLVKIYGTNGTSTTTLLKSFTAYTAATSGGVFVAAGDLDGDGRAEIITGAATNAQGHVRVFNGTTGAFLRSLTVAGSTSGAARVAAGDINGDGRLDLVVGLTTPGAASRARVYDAVTMQEMFAGEGKFTFGNGYAGGLFAAALNKTAGVFTP